MKTLIFFLLFTTYNESDLLKNQVTLAKTLKENGYIQKAVKKYEEILLVNKSAYLYIDIASLHQQNGESEKALTILKTAEKELIDNFRITEQLALVYFDMENYEESKKYFFKVLKNKEDADIIKRVAVLFNRLDKEEESLYYYEILVNKYKLYDYYLNLGLLYEKFGKIEEAEKSLENYHSLSENKDYAKNFLKKFYKKYNKTEKLEQLEQNTIKIKKEMRPLLKSKR